MITYTTSKLSVFFFGATSILRECPSENHAEWSTDHLSDSLHIWHTYFMQK